MDPDFIKMQNFAHHLFESLPIIKEDAIKGVKIKNQNEKELINQLQYQCVCYGRKLVSIFDKYQTLAKKQNENIQTLLKNIAGVCKNNIQPTEANICQYIQNLHKEKDQLNLKIQYLNEQFNEQTATNLLQHEQKMSAELEQMVDRLMKEIEQCSDEKFQLQAQYEEQIQSNQAIQKQISSLILSLSSKLKSLLPTQVIEGDFHFWKQPSSASKPVELEQQMRQACTGLMCLVEQLQLSHEDGLTRERDQHIRDNELIEDEMRRAQEQLDELSGLESQLIAKQQQERHLKQEINEFVQEVQRCVQSNYRSVRNALEQVRKVNDQKGVGMRLHEELMRVAENDLSDGIAHMRVLISDVVKRSSMGEIQMSDLKGKIKQSMAELEQRQFDDNERHQRLVVCVEEGVSRAILAVNELSHLADSKEALRLIKMCRDEIEHLQGSLSNSKNTGFEEEMQTQRMLCVRQVEKFREHFSQQEDQLIKDLECELERNRLLAQLVEDQEQSKEELMKELGQSKEYHKEYDNQIKSLSMMLQEQESEVRKMHNECSKQLSMLEQQQEQLKSQTVRLNALEEEKMVLSGEVVTSRKTIEEMRRLKMQSNESQIEKYRKGLEEKEGQIKQVEKEISGLKVKYIEKIEELEEMQQMLIGKENEIECLIATFNDLEEFSKRQLDLIQHYEDQMNAIYISKKSMENDCHTHGSQILQLQQKCDQYQQLLNQSGQESQNLKRDNEKYVQSYMDTQELIAELQRQVAEYQVSVQQLRAQNDDSKDKIGKLQQIQQILKDENKTIKQASVAKDLELEKALKLGRSLQQSVWDLQRKLDDYQHNIDDINQNQRVFEQLQSKITQLTQENYQLRNTKDIKFQSADLTSSNRKRDEQLNGEVNNLKSELRRMEDLLDSERNLYQQELRNQLTKMMDLQTKPPKAELFYENMLEAKDLEITRLTNQLKYYQRN